jgi:hypothetical protein
VGLLFERVNWRAEMEVFNTVRLVIHILCIGKWYLVGRLDDLLSGYWCPRRKVQHESLIRHCLLDHDFARQSYSRTLRQTANLIAPFLAVYKARKWWTLILKWKISKNFGNFFCRGSQSDLSARNISERIQTRYTLRFSTTLLRCVLDSNKRVTKTWSKCILVLLLPVMVILPLVTMVFEHFDPQLQH